MLRELLKTLFHSLNTIFFARQFNYLVLTELLTNVTASVQV